MIHNEKEYREAVGRLAEESIRLVEYRARLRERGLATDEIKRVVDPMKSFHLQLKEALQQNPWVKRGLESGSSARLQERTAGLIATVSGVPVRMDRHPARRGASPCDLPLRGFPPAP
jgi:hypothetical protein